MITIVIYTHNSERDIVECIESSKLLTPTIIVIDMESTDGTTHLATTHNAQVHLFPFTPYVEPAREFGIQKATTDWVFILDADERMTPELAREIQQEITKNAHTHYTVSRKNIFGRKQWFRHGGWWPDHQIRLFKKASLISWPKEIHSTPQFEGAQGKLQSAFLHYFHGDFQTMVEKTIVFEDIESTLLYKANRKVSTPIFFRKFFGELYRRIIKHAGYLDGKIGIMEGIYQAFSKTITYLYLYEKKKSGSV